jgi:hypothetical protein
LVSAFLLLFLLIASAFALAPVSASVPKPTVPEFTLQLVAHPYDFAPTYTVDPYTGQSVLKENGYRAKNMSIEVTITNQQYSYSSNGVAYDIYYDVRQKPHFSDYWNEMSRPVSHWIDDSFTERLFASGVKQTESNVTVLSLPADYSPNTQIDVEVRAAVGHNQNYWIVDSYDFSSAPSRHWVHGVALDDMSNWSSTQTLTVSYSEPTATPSAPPSWFDLSSFGAEAVLAVVVVVLATVVAVLAAAVTVLWRRVGGK